MVCKGIIAVSTAPDGLPLNREPGLRSEIMNIRTATNEDRDHIQRVYSSAFPEGESEIISKLAIDLLSEKTMPHTISLVAETDGAVVGHAAFSPVLIDNHVHIQGYILAPLAVKSDYQKRGIGSKLIAYGMQMLSAAGIHVVFVYGDPKYYSRFGFSADAAGLYTAPYKLQYPLGWHAAVLKECTIEKPPAAITCVSALCDPKLW